MALKYQKIAKKPKLFQKLTTLALQEFEILADKLQPEWETTEYRRKADRTDRKNAVGQGHPYFADFPTLLLLMVCYVKTGCGNLLLCLVFGIDERTLYDLLPKLLPLLQDRFVPNTILTSQGKRRKVRARIHSLDDLLKEYPELKSVIADGTDILTRRPKRRQKKNYSGKSKKHSKKTVLLVNSQDGLIVAKTKLRPASVHDKRVLEEDPLHKRLDAATDLEKRADSAWTGENPANGWLVNKKAVRGHPLTEIDKADNRKLSKIRIGVEHAIRRVKVFQRIGQKTTFRLKDRLDEVLNVAINLANFKQLMRHPITA